MSRGIVMIAGGLGLATAGCHPPDQAIYDDSRKCVGVFDVALAHIPPGRLRQAGLYHDEVEHAALGAYELALGSGADTGRDRRTIIREVIATEQQARAAYRILDANRSRQLIMEVRRCMPKPDGPND